MASPTTTASPSDDGDFFDDDNNKAMYLVLPAMILIYGSCCLVYCIHKCRRYCVIKSKKKKKAENRKLMKKEGNSFDNGGMTIQEETGPGPSGNPPPVVLTLENMESDHRAGNGRTSRVCQETDVDSLVDVLQTESVSAVSPGYQGASLRQEMQHLDNQLKAAFRLTSQDGSKPKGMSEHKKPGQPSPQPALKARNGTTATHQRTHRSDVIQAYMDWKALQKTQPPKLEVKFTPSGDTVVVRIPKEKRLQMIQQQQNEESSQSADTTTQAEGDSQEADVAAMLDVRKKINKEFPKSMPDILKKPDENGVVLKKLSSDAKRRIYLSCQ